MGRRWRITSYHGHNILLERWVSGVLSDNQILQLLARLHARHLNDEEVISATTRSKGKARTTEFVIPLNSGQNGYMTTGSPEYYTARYEEANARQT